MLIDEKYRVANVRRLAEYHQKLLVATLFNISSQYRELTALLSSLSIADDHADFGTTVGTRVVRGEIRTTDYFVGVHQWIRLRSKRRG
jgi:hypothetical protein